MYSQVMVSIICNAYNHERYIRDALDGFVMQKTNFLYEVLIHDDASTDSTADIIREYQEKYPDIIKPIYQTENQYSKRIGITKTFQLPRVTGKYIAFCEGDDYWTDPNKLQKQFDILEKHSNVDICSHRVQKEYSGILKDFIAPAKKTSHFTVEEVISGGGGFVGTNSLFFRAENMLNIPHFAQVINMDYVWQIQGSLRGGMIYLDDCMSVYRIQTENSWSKRVGNNKEKHIVHTKRIIQMLLALDEYTDFKYTKIVNSKIAHCNYVILRFATTYNELLNEEEFKKIPFTYKVKLLLRLFLKKIKDKK